MPQKKQFQTEDLFNNSEDDNDILAPVKESCINYATDFDKWTVHHYYAMKKRENFPNMFFYYFPRSLFLMSKISELDKAKIAEYIFNNNNKNLNGKWGYLSLLLDNKNINGVELFNSIYNNRAIVDLSNSFPMKEDAKPDFDKNIELEVENILENKKELYNKVLKDFENYLKEQTNEETKKKYYNFIKKHEDLYIYCDKSNKMCELINQINGVKYNSKNNKQANDNIFLLPKNYYELYDNIFNKIKDNKNDKLNKNNSNNNGSKRVKKKLRKKKKLYKCDFDLDFYDDSIINNSLVENNNYEVEIKNHNTLNISNINNEQSQKVQNKKYKKKDISLSNKIKYFEDKDKDQYYKNNDINNNQNRNTLNINDSINLSTNYNIFSKNSNANDTNLLTNQTIKNKNDISNKENNNYIFDFNKEDIEFFQNERNFNGYTSDFTKKVYYQNEINNKILVFSDNEDEIYLQKLAPNKNKKVTRIKVNEPVTIREKNIKNYNDLNIIGIESIYINKNIEKLKRGLLHKKQKIKRKINNKKRNIMINQLKKKYKEEDFNDIKYQKGNYKKLIREMNNFEKNIKTKKGKYNKDKIANYEKNNKNNIYNKKSIYYEIMSTKNFNLDTSNNILKNKNLNEYKKDRNFFNCFNNREKEDINFSDTESFLQLFNNKQNSYQNKRRNKKKIIYDNAKNQNIMAFFPKTGKTNFHKDKQIIISMKKLIDNEKFSNLFEFIENDINAGGVIPHYISNISIEIFNNSNDINFEKINTCKSNNGQYEILYNNSNNQDYIGNNLISNNKMIINNKYDIEKLVPLFKVYLEKIQIALTFLLTESKNINSELNYYEKEKNFIQNEINFQELNIVENIMKEMISNLNITKAFNFSKNINFNNSILNNESLKKELNLYINKIKNTFNDSFNEIISQIFITYLRFFISYKPKEIKFMDVKDFCFMSYSFLQIMQVLFMKLKELENIYKQLDYNNIIEICNWRSLIEFTNKYMKCICLFLLNHLYIYNTNDYIPLVSNNNPKKTCKYSQKSTPQESLILVSLFKLISSLYIENNTYFNYNNINNNDDKSNQKNNEAIIMFHTLFSEFLNNEIVIDTNNLGSLNEIIIKDLRFYLSSNENNCLSKEKKNLSIISNLKKAFLYNCFDIDNLVENDFSIKNIVNKKIIINLIQRYLFLLISYFIYYGKEINCVKIFNDFYVKHNHIKANGNSYFDVETISKDIINKNSKLNGNSKVKDYLVEEYIYSDIKLMNFYDRYWTIEFKDKKDFFKNYFEIMCNCKYNSRIIDDIFHKNEIMLLINYIFEFTNNNNINNGNDDFYFDNDEEISIGNNGNKINRYKILNSMDSILIKALYLISESINKTLISLEANNSENKIKANLSTFVSIKNIFNANISDLNRKNNKLCIIPIISTILTFSQHLLKFKEGKNIENTINKIKDILKLETSGMLLKRLSLSIWINIIQKISEKNINIDIQKYIEMLNLVIRQIMEIYHKHNELGFSMKSYNDPNYSIWNKNNEKEYFEIICEYLLNIKNFTENNPDFLIKYYSILIEVNNILNIKYYYPPKIRIQFLNIINSLIQHLNIIHEKIKKDNNSDNNLKNVYQKDNISKNKNNEDEMILDDDEIEFLLSGEVDEFQEGFLNFLQEEIIPKLKEILDKFISTENTNVSTRQKILYPLYEEISCLHANVFGILIKYKKIYEHLEYPRYVFNLYYDKENVNNNLFDAAFQNVYSNRNDFEKENYIKLPFKLFDLYLDYYNNLIYEIISQKTFVATINYILKLFFVGIFINSKNNNIINYEEKYCCKILKMIKNNQILLNEEKERIKNVYNKRIYISNDDKQRISIYNLLIVLSKIYEQKIPDKNYEFNNIIIGELLSNLSIDFDIDKIDSELLFELINGQKTKYALMKINKITNNSNNKSNLLNENETNIKLYILSKYLEPYITSTLNNKFTSYIDDFINSLSGDQLISSIVTMNFLNSLLSKKTPIPNKFKNCLINIYNTFISKAGDICNIISIQNKEGKINEFFTNKEFNEIISSYNNKSHINNCKKYFNSLEISFHLKRNIVNNFVTEIPLDNLISSNFFINLLKFMNKQGNNSSIFINKNFMEYYSESIYYYICLCNIMLKEDKIDEIKKSIELLFELIENNNKINNYVADIKSFYIFIYFLELINTFIVTAIRFEDKESSSLFTSSILSEKLLSHNFIKKTIKFIECFVSFMYNYIIYIIKGYKCEDKYIHSFILKKINLTVNKKQTYFNLRNQNCEQSGNNFLDNYINDKYGIQIMIKGHNIVEKIINIIKIYSNDNEDIKPKIDFINYVNFNGYQFIKKN